VSVPLPHVFEHYERAGQATGRFRYCPLCTTALTLVESGQELRATCPACGFVQYRNPAPAVSVLVVDKGQVLLGKRRGEPGRGTWALPSGYIEYGEDFLSTGVREVKEETGLDVQICAIVNVVSSFVSPRFHFLGIYLAARLLGGELAAGDDLAAVDWFPLEGPLPEMGFQEDMAVVEMCARQAAEGLAGQPMCGGPFAIPVETTLLVQAPAAKPGEMILT
jgi:8-oxo-dGTP diphosphatase